MNRNETLSAVELSINLKTAKNGNEYASGAIIFTDSDGKFQASIPYISFDEVGTLRMLKAQMESQEVAGGDLAFDGTEQDTRERKPVKQPRPIVTVSGWLTSKSKDGFKPVSFVIEKVHI